MATLLIAMSCALWVTVGAGLAKSNDGEKCARSDWQFVTSQERLVFSEISFLDSRVAYGHDGTCLSVTSTGGRAWKRVYCVPSDPDMEDKLSDMQFLTEAEGWLLEGGHLMHSRDGGRSWSKHVFNGAIVRGVRFLDSRSGWWVGERNPGGVPDAVGVIYATSDGGNTWREVATGIDVDYRWRFEDIWVAPASDIWVVGSFVLRSNDGGKTWQQAKLAAPESTSLRNVKIQFSGQKVGWIRRVPSENYLLTRNGGQNWRLRLPPTNPPFLDDLLYLGSSEAWAVAGGIYRSSDGGRSWRSVLEGGDEASGSPSYFALQYLRDERVLIATGNKGIALCRLGADDAHTRSSSRSRK